METTRCAYLVPRSQTLALYETNTYHWCSRYRYSLTTTQQTDMHRCKDHSSSEVFKFRAGFSTVVHSYSYIRNVCRKRRNIHGGLIFVGSNTMAIPTKICTHEELAAVGYSLIHENLSPRKFSPRNIVTTKGSTFTVVYSKQPQNLDVGSLTLTMNCNSTKSNTVRNIFVSQAMQTPSAPCTACETSNICRR